MKFLDFKEIWQIPWWRILRPVYRPNVAVIVRNEKGEILLCERIFPVGAVQTVQGGIDKGEDVVEAGVREVVEELGIDVSAVRPISYLLSRWRYDFPRPVSWAIRLSGYRGQEQQFLLVEIPSDIAFKLDAHLPEFARVWWEKPEHVLAQVSDLKRPGIEMALKGFGII